MRGFLDELLRRLVQRRGGAASGDPFLLDHSLLSLPGGDHWRVRDACEGTQVFGMTGSGKTNGSGKTLSNAFLSAQFGGLVLFAIFD